MIKIEAKRLKRRLNSIIKSMNGMRPALVSSGSIIIKEAKENFQKQGYNYGRAWLPLAQSTREQRKRLGYSPNRPILVRTGKLKAGTYISNTTNNSVTVSNRVRYAATHQFGNRKRNIPARKILGSSEKSRKAIALTIINHILGNAIHY